MNIVVICSMHMMEMARESMFMMYAAFMHNWLVTGSYTIYLSNSRNPTKASKELQMCSVCDRGILSGKLESNHLVMNGALVKSDGNTMNTPNIS